MLLQDFTGVPAVVDLAAMRDAIAALGGDPARINPLIPSDLVIDHSVQVDDVRARALRSRATSSSRWSETASATRSCAGASRRSSDLKVVPPGTGIVHQVNLEYLARVVEGRDGVAFPDTVVGTDSHTTMVNGLGVLGWGVGGIEAEAAMLGEPLSMLVPQVVGFRLARRAARRDDRDRPRAHRGRAAAHDGRGRQVRRVLRRRRLAALTVADRATLGNMSPEYGATCGYFPVDELTLDYLRLTGRSAEQVALVEAYCRENLLWHEPDEHPEYSQVVELDLDEVEPSLAGPRRPQDRVPLTPREGVVPRGARELRGRARRRRRGRRDLPRERPDHRAGAGGRAPSTSTRPSRRRPAGPARPRHDRGRGGRARATARS